MKLSSLRDQQPFFHVTFFVELRKILSIGYLEQIFLELLLQLLKNVLISALKTVEDMFSLTNFINISYVICKIGFDFNDQWLILISSQRSFIVSLNISYIHEVPQIKVN